MNLEYIDLSENNLSIHSPLTILCYSSVCNLDTKQSQINANEKEMLVSIYKSMNGDNWFYNDGWLTNSDPCLDYWFGVICGNDGTVTVLDLSRNKLEG